MKTSQLNLAIQKGQIEVISQLIEQGVNINGTYENENTPLHVATMFGNVRIIKLLINAGANVNTKNTCGETPLHFAVQSLEVNICKLLIDAGANLNEKNKMEETPLHAALKLSYYDPELDKNLSRVALEAERDVKTLIVVKLLVDSGADVNAQDNERGPVLFYAIRKRNLNYLKYLLKAGADASASDKKGNPLLNFAIYKNNPDAVEILIGAGACVNAKNFLDYSSINLTVERYKDLRIIKLLAKAGANLNELTRSIIMMSPFMVFTLLLYQVKKETENINAASEFLRFTIECIDVNFVEYMEANIFFHILNSRYFSSPEKNIFCRIIIQLIAKLKALDFQVNLSLLNHISNSVDDNKYFTQCIEELEKMKNTKPYDCWVTFFNLLTDDERKFVKYAGNKKLIKDCSEANLKKKFPIYWETIKNNIDEGIIGRKLFDAAAISLSDHLPIFNASHLIILNILDALNELSWKLLSPISSNKPCLRKRCKQ